MTRPAFPCRLWTPALAVLLTLTSSAAGQPVIIAPQSVPVGGLCIIRVDGLENDAKFSWQAIPPDTQTADLMERDGSPVLFVATNRAGLVHLVLAYSDAEGIHQQLATVLIGGGPGPGPIPPGPGPGPSPVPPGPEPPPVTEGKRTLLIVRETADSTPAMRSLVTLLRTGEHAAYLTSKGHQLAILDDDSVDAGGNPSPVVESWRPHFAGLTLPVLIIIDQATGQIVHKHELPATATAADVMRMLRENGG